MPNIAVFPEMLKHTSQEVSLRWVSHWKFRLQFHDCFELIEICAAAQRNRPALPVSGLAPSLCNQS